MSWFKKRAWRPTNCHSRYASYYEFQEDETTPEEVNGTPEEEIPKEESPAKGTWCAACMREAFDPLCLSCGHQFCRRCLAGMRHNLVSEFSDVVKDVRAPLKCPLLGCRTVVRCLPYVNGDFRFTQIRPSDKVQCERKEPISAELLELLCTYNLTIDVDMTVPKQNSIFKTMKSSRSLYKGRNKDESLISKQFPQT